MKGIKEMTKYLITGGCGFLGSNIAAHILEHKMGDVLILDNLSRVGSDKNYDWLKTLGHFGFPCCFDRC